MNMFSHICLYLRPHKTRKTYAVNALYLFCLLSVLIMLSTDFFSFMAIYAITLAGFMSLMMTLLPLSYSFFASKISSQGSSLSITSISLLFDTNSLYLFIKPFLFLIPKIPFIRLLSISLWVSFLIPR